MHPGGWSRRLILGEGSASKILTGGDVGDDADRRGEVNRENAIEIDAAFVLASAQWPFHLVVIAAEFLLNDVRDAVHRVRQAPGDAHHGSRGHVGVDVDRDVAFACHGKVVQNRLDAPASDNPADLVLIDDGLHNRVGRGAVAEHEFIDRVGFLAGDPDFVHGQAVVVPAVLEHGIQFGDAAIAVTGQFRAGASGASREGRNVSAGAGLPSLVQQAVVSIGVLAVVVRVGWEGCP